MELTYPIAYSSDPGVTLLKATKPALPVEEQEKAAGKYRAQAGEPIKYARAPDASGVTTSSRPPATQDNSR